MRWVLALLALLLLPWTSALAQDATPAAGPALLLEDKTGDYSMDVAGAPAGNPSGQFAQADLVSLSLDESMEAFTFHLTVANLAPQPEPPQAGNVLYGIEFSDGANAYRVEAYRTVSSNAPSYYAFYQAYDPGRAQFDGQQQLTIQAAGNTMDIAVPRDMVIDQNGASPFPGQSLTQLRVTAQTIGTDFQGGNCGPLGACPVPDSGGGDTMPDKGFGDLAYPIRLGVGQTGYARLFSDTPIRSSNGEATTFVFPVNATNQDGKTHRFTLATDGVPGTWQVHVPSDFVELAANQTSTLPILVTTPFAHAHGTVAGFTFTMTSVDDAGSVGRIHLGIRYPNPPQPAGHHNQLFLHAFPESSDTFTTAFATAFGFEASGLYFNTLSTDEDKGDGHNPIAGEWNGFNPPTPSGPSAPQQSYAWTIPLNPVLDMGLDFDENATGTLRVTVGTVLPMLGATLEGRFVYTMPSDSACDPRQDPQNQCGYTADDYRFGHGTHLTVATIATTKPQDVGANSPSTAFESVITPTPEGDYIPFHKDAVFALQLVLNFTRVDPFLGPHDAPKVAGGEMQMPLLEYHDPVSQVFTSTSHLMIQVTGDQERMVNPGKTAVFDLTLMNHGDSDTAYDLAVTGPNHDWSRILGDAHVLVPKGQTRQLAVAVIVPAGSADGTKADLVLTASETADPTLRTLARLVATVDSKADHPDDSARVPGLASQLTAKKSPMPEAPLLLACLAALALLGRRRR